MNYYEIIVISKQENYFNLRKFVIFILNFIIKNNCLILKLENWGLKNFSYSIKKRKRGYYIYFVFLLSIDILNKIIFHLKNNKDILRYLIFNLKNFNFNISLFVIKKLKKFYEKKFI